MCKNNFLVETEVYKRFYTLRVGNKNTYFFGPTATMSVFVSLVYSWMLEAFII